MHSRHAYTGLLGLSIYSGRSVSCRTLAASFKFRPNGTILFTRGAKRKTTISLDDLAIGPIQGALPAIARPEPVEVETAKVYPPVLQQHLNNVRTYSDCIVLTRVGDFYEMYFDQVDQYAGLVGLKKGKRATVLGAVAMAGFQHTQLDRYLKMFVQDLGKQVAISEQIRLEEHERVSRAGQAMYDRRVTRVVTPGTLVDESFIATLENNYLMAISFEKDISGQQPKSTRVGLGWVDVSSGDFNLQDADVSALPSLIARVGPREIVVDVALQQKGVKELQKLFGEHAQMLSFHDAQHSQYKEPTDWLSMLEDNVVLPNNFSKQEVAAGDIILDYIATRLMKTEIKLQRPSRRSESEFMMIDKQSLRALEIKATLRDGVQQGSLLHAIRKTVTNSGARLLSQRIVSPSMSLQVITHRLDLVQEMLAEPRLQQDITALLSDTSDTFRLLQKFSLGKGDADDMLGLARTIKVTMRIRESLQEHKNDREHRLVPGDHYQQHSDGPVEMGCIKDILQRLDVTTPSQLAKSIFTAIDEESLSQQQRIEIEKAEQTEKLAEEVAAADNDGREAPKLAKRMLKASGSTRASADESEDIWIMRREASIALSAAHKVLDALLAEKQELASQLRSLLGTDSLSLKWTPQYGHFCHIKGKDTAKSLTALKGVRSFYSTKTTRSFYAPDWTKLGQKIDSARQHIRAEEDRVFIKLKARVFENLMRLRRNAAILDELDVTCSSAVVAKERHWVRPIIDESCSHVIYAGRHPTVDQNLLSQGRKFTANDCIMRSDQLIHLITGPNMGGKSTYLRQNALITILAQTGCYVPAEYAQIGLVDKIFSRVGSADNLYQDQSTFMVEMIETAEILRHATPRSFVIMDEIGRGTTPEDGVAVGYACLDHLHRINNCRTLFATHFHKLADMVDDFDKIKPYCTDVVETDDESWFYAHKLKPGINRDSHALKVVKMAGLPQEAVDTAARVIADPDAFTRQHETAQPQAAVA